ncbi:MAG: rhamnulokinase, partial [Bacilli bacterium]|nr:rhamnulokinase [Bacilli bacterium]
PIITRESCEANYTNEGGVGYIRFLKNIMGMYVANLLRKEVGLCIEEVNARLPHSTYQRYFDINDPSLSAPKSMKEALLRLLKEEPPKDDIDLFASIYLSMAIAYRKAVEELERIVRKEYRSIYVIGGGAKSEYLNRLIEEYTKKKVIALPIEATALGNIKIQMKASKQG